MHLLEEKIIRIIKNCEDLNDIDELLSAVSLGYLSPDFYRDPDVVAYCQNENHFRSNGRLKLWLPEKK